MRPATYEPEQIIEAGLALQAEGRNITGSHYVTRWVAAIRHVSARYGTNTRLHRARSSLNPLPSCQWKWLKK